MAPGIKRWEYLETRMHAKVEGLITDSRKRKSERDVRYCFSILMIRIEKQGFACLRHAAVRNKRTPDVTRLSTAIISAMIHSPT